MTEIRFMLVDDDVDDVLVFKEMTESLHRKVILTVANNGEESLEQLRKAGDKLPDVIFLDLNMPRMDGKECLNEIKHDPALSKIPVIMYTTSSQSSDIEETMMNGAACFITKPTNVSELQEILATIADSLPNHLPDALRELSETSNTFIVC